MAFDPKKPHSVHTDSTRITTYDQDGILYDSVTFQELGGDFTVLGEKYVIPLKAPFSRVRTERERWNDALRTMQDSGALNGEDAAKLRAMVALSEMEVVAEQ
jgi:hypothetical protein